MGESNDFAKQDSHRETHRNQMMIVVILYAIFIRVAAGVDENDEWAGSD